MKIYIILSALFICNFQTILSQNIYSALNHNESGKPDIRKDTEVKKIIQETSFFNRNGIEVEKTEFILNDSNRIVVENRFNEYYNRKTRLVFKYDSTQVNCLSRRMDINQPYISNSNTAYYNYDSIGFLTKIIEQNNTEVFRITNIENNERGNPIKLEVYEYSIFIGKETAEYDYENNMMKTTVYNSADEILSVTTEKINYSINDTAEIRNNYGDLIQTNLFKFEYKYDKFGNWKKQIRYMLKNNIWEKNAVFIRTITYRN